MSTKYNDRNSGGASIIPSARRGIHDINPTNPQEVMGRKGLTESDEEEFGVDEVDNVLSKFKRTPVKPVKKPGLKPPNQIIRRNSLDESPTWDYDSDEEVHLSKSLPTPLQCSSYSNENGINITSNSNSATDPSPSKSQINERDNSYSFRNNRSYLERNYYQQQYLPEYHHEQKQNSSTIWFILPTLLGVLAVIYYSYFGASQVKTDNYDIFKFYNDMDILKSKYKISRDSILQLQSGISTIYSREDTGSFVFIYDSGANSFKAEKLDMLIDHISSSAAKYLRNNTLPVRHLKLSGSGLQMSTHSELVSRYREAVSKSGVMLVTDVDHVPSNLAMAFHYYCDEINPLETKTAIFFTLDLAKCNDRSEDKTTHTKVEKCLANKWSGVAEDKIRPLLTRVVSVVIDLTHVF